MAKSIQFSFRSTGAVALIALSALAGCATQSSSGQVYREGETRRAQIIEQGTVESVRMVTIQGDTNGVGTAAGGIIGGIAGSNVGAQWVQSWVQWLAVWPVKPLSATRRLARVLKSPFAWTTAPCALMFKMQRVKTSVPATAFGL
jgi:hypothetical protein